MNTASNPSLHTTILSSRKSPFVTIPVTIRAAMRFCELHHSYLSFPRGAMFAIGTATKAQPQHAVCIAIIGRPRNVHLQSIGACEVYRLVSTAEQFGAASRTLATASHAARILGYSRIISYVDASKAATCYRAAGWNLASRSKRRGWHGRQPRISDPSETCRYEVVFSTHQLD